MGSQLNDYLRDDIFRTRRRSNEHLFVAPERPNQRLEVRFHLVTPISTIYRNLDIALNRDGMRITRTDQVRNVITVAGTPPEFGYNADTVLEVVRGHDNGAQIVQQ
ncbi:hypothetical protein M758_10G017500 [Ceratodon purpureus]|uniref:Uncharacterized protein n=1 Tax=Ceratodon purpureus TaxID=3225 RepID=A0A8T0GIE2_CERPU|nr:hypothetical protein KC19_10G018500 [Ceratodon purpureus]KAG0602488.1 hypothetical protein M758_10G017500 [Ceratodon purpureus]